MVKFLFYNTRQSNKVLKKKEVTGFDVSCNGLIYLLKREWGWRDCNR